jgi:hypothetical protein
MTLETATPDPRLYRRPAHKVADAALCVLAAGAANACLMAWGRRSFVPLELVATGSVLLALLLLVLAGAIYAFCRRGMNDAARLVLRTLLVSIVFFASTFLSLPLLQRQILRDMETAIAHANALLPVLDARWAAAGRYPDRLDEVAAGRDLPPLLRRSDFYRGAGTSFVMQIRVPGTPYAAAVLRSGDRQWRKLE